MWNKYEKKKRIADGLATQLEKNWNFYLGEQWAGLETGGETLPTSNFVKPIVKYKVSTICQNKVTANYVDIEEREELNETLKAVNNKFTSYWENTKMDSLVWKAVKTSAIEGTSYTYWGDPKKPQVLCSTSVILGDEQNQDIQAQPYIIVRERLSVDVVTELAKRNGIEGTILSDYDTFQVGEREEYDNDKVTCITYYERKNGIVYYAKCTRNVVYQPLTPIRYSIGNKPSGKGLGLYPLVNFVWEDKPNSARGKSEVETLIPNQITANKLQAYRIISAKQCSYPKIAYDPEVVGNPEALTEIGTAIEVRGSGVQSINQLVGYLTPTGLTSDVANLSGELMATTRELAGASDTTLGQIDPTRVAASAISALKDSAQVNINEQITKHRQYIEDTARLWLEMWIVYREPIRTTIDMLEDIQLDVKVDVVQDTTVSKDTTRQALDKLLELGHINIEEWATLLPDGSNVPKNALLSLIQKRSEDNVMRNMQQ